MPFLRRRPKEHSRCPRCGGGKLAGVAVEAYWRGQLIGTKQTTCKECGYVIRYH